jgi:hypothetical protein
VLVHELPRAEWLSHLVKHGVRLPTFRAHARPSGSWPLPPEGEKWAELRPWGWTPRLLAGAARLGDQVHVKPPAIGASISAASSKLHSLRAVRQWLNEHRHTLDPDAEWLAPDEDIGVIAEDWPGVVSEAQRLTRRGFTKIVLKSPWGTAGRGLRLLEPERIQGARRWAESLLIAQGGLRIEPWLDRCFDFSTQFNIDSSGSVKLLGASQCLSDRKGRFTGAVIGPLGIGQSPEIRRSLYEDRRIGRLLKALPSLLPSLVGAQWLGEPLGLDHFVYRRPDGALRIRPAVECNPRHTMGQVALSLRALMSPGSVGAWLWLPARRLRTSPEALLPHVSADLSSRDGTGRIQQGVIWTTDPARSPQHMSVLVVSKNLRALAESIAALPFDRISELPLLQICSRSATLR